MRHGEQGRRRHVGGGGPGVRVDPGRQRGRVALAREVDNRRRVQLRGGDDGNRAAHRRPDEGHRACPPAAQFGHRGGDVGRRVAAAARARRAAEAAQVEQQRPDAVAGQVARVRQPAAVVARVLVDEHRADRPRTDDGPRERDAVARAETDRLGAHARLGARSVRGGRATGHGSGPVAGSRMGAAAAGDSDQQRCEQSEPQSHGRHLPSGGRP
jgi:hypothetical protein